jgi:hypothetical protein
VGSYEPVNWPHSIVILTAVRTWNLPTSWRGQQLLASHCSYTAAVASSVLCVLCLSCLKTRQYFHRSQANTGRCGNDVAHSQRHTNHSDATATSAQVTTCHTARVSVSQCSRKTFVQPRSGVWFVGRSRDLPHLWPLHNGFYLTRSWWSHLSVYYADSQIYCHRSPHTSHVRICRTPMSVCVRSGRVCVSLCHLLASSTLCLGTTYFVCVSRILLQFFQRWKERFCVVSTAILTECFILSACPP